MSLMVKLAPKSVTAIPLSADYFLLEMAFFPNTLCDCGTNSDLSKVEGV